MHSLKDVVSKWRGAERAEAGDGSSTGRWNSLYLATLTHFSHHKRDR